jgi:hypothetical protein
MGWDRGRYYTRSRKVNGRVVREYVGGGELAELAARLDAIQRQEREAERATRQGERAELDTLDEPVDRMCQEVELLARAALRATGYHQHKRGEWRKRRDRP